MKKSVTTSIVIVALVVSVLAVGNLVLNYGDVSLSPANSTKMFSFNAKAGEVFSFGITSGLKDIYWRLVDSFNNIVFAGPASAAVLDIPLPTTGAYTLMFEGNIYLMDTVSFQSVYVNYGGQTPGMEGFSIPPVFVPFFLFIDRLPASGART